MATSFGDLIALVASSALQGVRKCGGGEVKGEGHAPQELSVVQGKVRNGRNGILPLIQTSLSIENVYCRHWVQLSCEESFQFRRVKTSKPIDR